MNQHKFNQVNYMKKFACLQDQCPQDCCSNWVIGIEQPIYDRWVNKAQPLLFLCETRTSDDGYKMCMTSNDLCVAFRNKKCIIHADYGDEYLPEICFYFPILYKKLNNEIFATSDLACFASAKLALQAEKNDWGFHETSCERIKEYITEYLDTPGSLSKDQVLDLHATILGFMDNDAYTADQLMAKMLIFSSLLDKIKECDWPNMINRLFTMTEDKMSTILNNTLEFDMDQQTGNILYAILTLTKDSHRRDYFQMMMDKMSAALNHKNGYAELLERWNIKANQKLVPIFKNYIKTKLNAQLFPIGGYFTAQWDNMLVIAVEYLTVRLAVMTLIDQNGELPSMDDIILTIQHFELLYHAKRQQKRFDIYNESELNDLYKLINLTIQ